MTCLVFATQMEPKQKQEHKHLVRLHLKECNSIENNAFSLKYFIDAYVLKYYATKNIPSYYCFYKNLTLLFFTLLLKLQEV